MRHLILIVAALAALAITVASVAAPPTPTTLSGPLDPVTLAPLASPPHIGDLVQFRATTDDPFPWVQVQCFQGGVLMYSEHHGALPGIYGYDVPFQLGPTLVWPAGDANCTATVRATKRGALDKILTAITFTTLG